ncbi:hypothetical protein QL285_044583 [Trifolium repens]|nr:hypothetical protein QL285_044583 [Trifolium repens]
MAAGHLSTSNHPSQPPTTSTTHTPTGSHETSTKKHQISAKTTPRSSGAAVTFTRKTKREHRDRKNEKTKNRPKKRNRSAGKREHRSDIRVVRRAKRCSSHHHICLYILRIGFG